MLDIIRKPKRQPHINPRIRAYGKARIDIAQRAATRDDWDRLWKKSTYPFPFSWGNSWKQCIEYKVEDFPAEVGFFIDILGFPVNAFDPDYAMFTSPSGDFFFSVVPVQNKAEVTAPDSLRLQFMVERIMDTAIELERRGVSFDQWPSVSSSQSTLIIGSFHTPNGISIDLWGFDPPEDHTDSDLQSAFLGDDDRADNQVISEDTERDIEPEVDRSPVLSPTSDSQSEGEQNSERFEDVSEPDVDQPQLLNSSNGGLSTKNHIRDEPVEDDASEFEYVFEDDE